MCKHSNGILSEYATIENAKIVKNGVVDAIGDNNISNITGYRFECFDCGKSFRFQVNTKIKWLRRMYEKLAEA